MGGKNVRAAGAILCVAAALLTGGCAVSIPIPGFSSEDDDIKTGSIQPSEPIKTHVASWVDAEDSDFVLTALGEALDPQGAGNAVDWTNESRKGVVRPTGRAEPAGDVICRGFTAEGAGSFGPYRATGTACRDKRGVWAIRDSILRPRA